jgi:hypothetical protein
MSWELVKCEPNLGLWEHPPFSPLVTAIVHNQEVEAIAGWKDNE